MEQMKVSTGALTTGMYVAALDRPWTDTPFLFQGFLIREEQEIADLRKYCKFVYVDLEQGKRPPPCATLSPAKGGAPAEPVKLPLPKPSARYEDKRPVEEELKTAKQARASVTEAVGSFMEKLQHGAAPDLSSVQRAVALMEDSVLRNPDAFMLLSRLKTKDNYSYGRCIDTSMLAIAFGRQLGLPQDQIRLLGFGALLADAGKMKLPKSLLTKTGQLSDREFVALKRHVDHSLAIVRTIQSVHADVLAIVSTHHERVDGSGYPDGLMGAKIPLFGRMVGLVDTFDAMTSQRPYAPASSPQQVVKKLYEWRGSLFQEELVEQFIQMLGVYPVGSVVELTTGEVGIVIGQNRVRRLRPKVMLVLDPDKRPLDVTPVMDLMAETQTVDGRDIQIARTVEADEFDLDLADYYI